MGPVGFQSFGKVRPVITVTNFHFYNFQFYLFLLENLHTLTNRIYYFHLHIQKQAIKIILDCYFKIFVPYSNQ